MALSGNKVFHLKLVSHVKYKYFTLLYFTSNRNAFLKWYATRIEDNYVFDFQKEILEYCRSDVDILIRSMLKYRQDFIELETCRSITVCNNS